MSRIKDLIKEVKEICSSQRNQDLATFWQRFYNGEKVEKIPMIIYFEPIWWTKKLEYNYKELLMGSSVETIIEFQLEQKLFHYHNVPDDTVINVEVSPFPIGIPTKDPFGGEISYDFTTGTWRHVSPVLDQKEDLFKLPIPRFNKEEYLNKKKGILNRFNDVLEGEIKVNYDDEIEVGWYAPFSSATTVYGMQKMLTALADDPEFAHKLMDFVTQAKINYVEDKKRAFNGKEKNAFWVGEAMGEDEVDCNMISPRMYEELIFPYEKMQAETYDKCYYHSCGNITPILSITKNLPNLYKVEISPWTDLEKATKEIPEEIILEKTMLESKYLLSTHHDEMEKQIKEIVSLIGQRRAIIQCDAIAKSDLSQVQRWLDIAKKYA